jgi:hypothetical protein
MVTAYSLGYARGCDTLICRSRLWKHEANMYRNLPFFGSKVVLWETVKSKLKIRR